MDSPLNHFCRTAVLLLVASMCAGSANGQVVHPYVSGAIETSSTGVHSISSGASLTFDNTSDDNRGLGVVGEAGWFLRPNIAIGGQVDLPIGRTAIIQSHDYMNPYNRRSRFREWTAFGVVRAYVPRGRRVRLGGLAGAGVVSESSLDQISTCQLAPPYTCSVFGAESESTRLATGLTVGGDLVWEAIPRISVLPQFRLVWVDRGKIFGPNNSFDDTNLISLGLNQVSYRASIGIRFGL
jgi:hypothetical protein